MDLKLKKITEILKSGGIGVLPTDTLYGLVGSALNKKTVERIYKVRQRTPGKPLIVLIGSIKDLGLFGIKPDKDTLTIINKYWPGKVSIILPCPLKKFEYLHRGTKKVAFRLPRNQALLDILQTAGPLAAPSANPEGLPPARNLKEARDYFGDKVDFYSAGKVQDKQPSALIEIVGGKVVVLRPGSIKIKTMD